ncbi:hypothetical protein ISF_02857 [Cordyceps fumosorosea ARSEF 2679]|uniref:Uncharacterized protein n=1 Tax=Cordyceps fumosorosea (strain ARSEF 2679) TaxID=1081104 RepID=A0A168B3Y3_CORFA|nr:hypothetical protein ISF_02857 [Cordyceps fumosorosea ARSEF 2679]OAA69587.1 hypothetical protein ISF_02857 [Cordyceps fumosorosea ARSEF 2679]
MKLSTVIVATSAASFSMGKSTSSSSSVPTTFQTSTINPSEARPSPSTTFATKTKPPKATKTTTTRRLWTPIIQLAEILTAGWPWAGTDMCDNCWARAGVWPQPKYEDEYLKRAIERCKICCPPEKLGTKTCDPSPSPCIATRESRKDNLADGIFQNTDRPIPWNTSSGDVFPWSLVTPVLSSRSASLMSESLKSASAGKITETDKHSPKESAPPKT